MQNCTEPFLFGNETIGPFHLNYLSYYYCSPSIPSFLVLSFFILWLLWLFHLVGQTADVYFSPTLTCLCAKLNIPADVAGVTLLALGNGAPDLFSALSAYQANHAATAINALLSASILVTTALVGGISLHSPVQVSPTALARDCTALWCTVMSIGLLACFSQLSTFQVYWLPALYASYVLFVLIGHAYKTDSTQDDISKKEPSLHVMSAFWHMEGPPPPPKKYQFVTRSGAASSSMEYELSEPMLLSQPHSSALSFEGVSNVLPGYFPYEQNTASAPSSASSLFRHEESGDSDEHMELGSQRPANTTNSRQRVWQSLYFGHLRWKAQTERQWSAILKRETTIGRRIVLVLDAPWIFLRDLTIPLVEAESWNRSRAAFYPLAIPLFLLAVLEKGSDTSPIGHISNNLLCVLLAPIGLAFILFKAHVSKPPKHTLPLLFLLSVALTSCVGWMYLLASEIVALLASIGVITGIQPAVLGCTILAWGNALGDVIANISITRAGFPQMAIAACFGGPVFNLLMGLGLALWIQHSKTGTTSIPLDAHAILSILTLCITLPLTYTVFKKNNFSCPRPFAWTLLGIYGAYSVINLILMLF